MTTFGAETTTDAVLEGMDLSGRRFLVTGASAGLGVETTRALVAHGALVTMAVRDLDKGAAAIEQVQATVPDAQLDLRELDLADLASIRTFASGFLEDHPVLDVLICNAGIMACPQGTTTDGFETQFGTNHLGHFLLIRLLTPALVAAGQAGGARVVLLSSAGHRLGDVDLDDPGWERTPYDPWAAYGRSKTANVLCAVGVDRRLADQGVRAFAVHPGMIHTELARHVTEDTWNAFRAMLPPGDTTVAKSIPAGAATTVFAATSPDLDGLGGRYLEDCHLAEITDDPAQRSGVRAYALDPDRADALWELSERLVAEPREQRP
jgi:NAD(P)-dependent dehydrogenase (short-subunit alcohol dehydrogenase family)